MDRRLTTAFTTRRLRRRFVTAIAAVAALAALPFEADPVRAAAPVIPPSMRVETSYVLKSHLDWTAGTIVTAETIRIRNTSTAGIGAIDLAVMPRAFGELTSFGSLAVDGRSVTGAWTTNANFRLQLGRTLAPGASATVTLRFGVRATNDIDTSLEGRLSKAYGIIQVSHWFPIVSDGHALRYPGDAQYTLTARSIRLELTTSSSDVRIAAPGRRISVSGRTHVYQIENARDFAFGASPSYRVTTGSAAGVAIEVWGTTGDRFAALATARAAIARFESAFGEYQWTRYVVAQTGRPASGNEYPGIVFLGSSLFRDAEVVAHETAHQWWYAMAGNDQLRTPWLDEGLSEFAASYWFGAFHPYASSKPVDSPVTAFPNVPAPQTSAQPDSYDQTIYFKAARFLEGLRARMGSSAFFAGLRQFFAMNRNGVMTTAEFEQVMLARGASKAYLDQFLFYAG